VILNLTQGAAAPAALVDRSFPLCDQSRETKLFCNADKLVIVAAELIGEPDIVRRIFEKAAQRFTPDAQRLVAQVFALQGKKVKDVVHQRNVPGTLE
jgi:hypothetical protein